MRKCCVDQCKNKMKFCFPSNEKMRKIWLKAIRRPDFVPSKKMGLCIEHFKKTDLHLKNTLWGYDLQVTRLKPGVVPSIFHWNEQCEENEKNFNENNQEKNFEVVLVKEEIIDESLKIKYPQNYKTYLDALKSSNIMDENIDLEEIVIDAESSIKKEDIMMKSQKDANSPDTNSSKKLIQNKKQKYSIHEFENDPSAVLEFTGLENYEKFLTVLSSLGKEIKLTYVNNTGYGKLSLQDQFFLTLWKLRKYPTDKELSLHFGLQEEQVENIFNSWIVFMAKQWSQSDQWPSKELVQYYMPVNFIVNYPHTRVIMNGTEVFVQGSKNSEVQASTFNHNKNHTTLKVIVGNPSGGLFTHNGVHGGSASDRQFVKRSLVKEESEPVQDYFASHDVTVATPNLTKVKRHLPLNELLKDRKLAKFKVHVERIIGLLKTFKILSTTLKHNHVHLASEITSVCVMLYNFKECMMKKKYM